MPTLSDEVVAAKAYYDTIRVSYDLRIGQIWKSRYVVWGMQFAVGAFWLTSPRAAVWATDLVLLLVIAAATVIQIVFEQTQEKVLRCDRKYLFRIRRLMNETIRERSASFQSIPLEAALEERAQEGPVASLQLWWVTILLSGGLVALVTIEFIP